MIRTYRSSLLLLAALALAGCKKDFNDFVKCNSDSDCQSGSHCGSDNKCQTGEAKAKAVWTVPPAGTLLAGAVTFKAMVSHPDGVASAKLMKGATQVATFTAPNGNFGKGTPAEVSFSNVDTSGIDDGNIALTVIATDTHGVAGDGADRSFNFDNTKPHLTALSVTPISAAISRCDISSIR